MTTVVSIVEGDGEVVALPVLLRRLGEWLSPETTVSIARPFRVRRDRFLNKDSEFRRFLEIAAAKAGTEGWILVLLDADDDCPAEKGQEIVRRAVEVVPHRRVSVVLANREYEAWFLASASSLEGVRGFRSGKDAQVDAEAVRNAKGWMNQHLASGHYREILDQPAFSARFDLEQAFRRSRSFRKLCSEWTRHSGTFDGACRDP